MYFDTHAHYDDEAFETDREELLASMPEKSVSLIVDPGCDKESSEKAMDIAERYPYVYAAVGWHPQAADLWNDESEVLLRRWASNKKVVAIGEIGLDYYYEGAAKETQIAVFDRQLQLAKEFDLPVIVHDREAHADSLDAVRRAEGVRGVFHCYSGSAEMAKELLSRGWYLSFTGAITFKNARKALETIELAPLDRIMIETDSPYLTPVPHRGKRNDSGMLPYIAQAIADIKGISLAETVQITAENGKRFFGITQ